MLSTTSTCSLCGAIIRTSVPVSWHPQKLERRARRDLRDHLETRHSFAEILRYEIRRDLDEVPAEERPEIVRDVYRQILGTTVDGRFTLNAADGRGVYTFDEALGSVAVYRLWQSAARCWRPGCRHRS